MKQFILALLFSNLLVFHGFGQSIELNTGSYYGLWQNEGGRYYYGGGSFELLYEHPINKGALRGGIEFRTIDWGNQVALNVGFKGNYIQKEKWSLSGVTSAGLGLALFVKNPLFVYSIDYMPVFTWLRNKRFDYYVGLGIRFTHCPAYRNYSKVNQLIELPLKIGVTYKLSYKKNDPETNSSGSKIN